MSAASFANIPTPKAPPRKAIKEEKSELGNISDPKKLTVL